MILFGALIAAFDSEALRPRLEDVLWAAAQVGIPSAEKLALVLQVNRAQLQRQLAGEEHFSFSRMAAFLPMEFWGYLALRLATRTSLPELADAAAKLTKAKRKMLKMGEPVAERRTA